MRKQPAVTIEIEIKLRTQIFHPVYKRTVARVSAPRRMKLLGSSWLVEIMEFLYGRHPEIGMRLELLVEPRGSGFLGSNT